MDLDNGIIYGLINFEVEFCYGVLVLGMVENILRFGFYR